MTKLVRVFSLRACKRTRGTYFYPAATLLLALAVALGPAAWAGWDIDHPANNGAVVSGKLRDNWASIANSIDQHNVLRNGEMWEWAAGAAAAPDGWTLSGAACTIARTGTGEADTFTFGAGRYASKVTRAGTDCKLTWTVLSTTAIADETYVKGKRFVAAMLGKTSTASHLKLTIDDGVGTTSSDFHTGGGSTEYLTVARTLDAAATKIEIYAEIQTTNAAAYVGGVGAWFGDVAPKNASSTRTAMTDHGRFWAAPLFKWGASDGFVARAVGRVHTSTTTVGNVGGGPDTLMSYPVPIDAFSANGASVTISGGGTGANNANAKVLTWRFDGTSIHTSNSFTTDATRGWTFWCTVTREDATHAKSVCHSSYMGGAAAYTRSDYTRITVANWTTARTFLVEATTVTADSDIVQEMLHIRGD